MAVARIFDAVPVPQSIELRLRGTARDREATTMESIRCARFLLTGLLATVLWDTWSSSSWGQLGFPESPPVFESESSAEAVSEPAFGEPAPDRGYLGIVADAGTGDGIPVMTVEANSPAEKMGIRSGDRIVKLNEREIRDRADLSQALSPLGPQAPIEISVIRQGQTQPQILSGVLGKQPADDPSRGPMRPTLGVTVKNVLDVGDGSAPGGRGALVVAVRPSSPADVAKIPVGAVITSFDGHPIATYHELVQAVQNSEVGRIVPVQFLADGQDSTCNVKIGDAPAHGISTDSRWHAKDGRSEIASGSGAGGNAEQRVAEIRSRLQSLEQEMQELQQELRSLGQ